MRPWVIGALTLGADQFTKHLLTRRFAPGESLPVIPPLLSLSYVQNTGAAFGLFRGQQALFVCISLLVIAWMVWELRGTPATAMAPAARWGCALVLGGAAGNLIDRLRFGYVVDFIDLHVWPVFNVGDSAITIGVTLLLLHHLTWRRHAAPEP